MDLLFAWIASIASGITPLITKASSKTLIKNPWLFNVLWVTFRIPLVAILAIVMGASLPSDWPSLIYLSASAAAFYVLYTLAIYKLDVTTIAPLFSLRAVFATLLGILVLHEHTSVMVVVLMAIIILMSPFAAYSEKLRLKSFFQKPILLAVAAMAALALAGYFTNVSVDANGYAATLLWQDVLALIILLPTLKFVPKELRKIEKKKLLPFVLLGITGFAYVASATLAFANNLALSSVIVSLPLSMVFAYLLSKKYSQFLESHTNKVYAVRFFGAFIMVVCAIWLSFL